MHARTQLHRPTTSTWAKIAVTAGICLSSPLANALDWGAASVLSLQGQRLKVAVPYRLRANESPSILQFQVVSAHAESGSFAPTPGQFTISREQGENQIVLQSKERVFAYRLSITLSIASEPAGAARYDLLIPPQ